MSKFSEKIILFKDKNLEFNNMVKYECPRCGYSTEKKTNMKNHINRKNMCKPVLNDNNLKKYKEQLLSNKSNVCKSCNKEFTRIDNRKRHEKSCQERIENDRIKELEEQIKQLKGEKTPVINNTTNNTTNNNTFNIVILPYREPDVSHLTDHDYYNSIDKCIMAVPLLIKKIHFNKDKPENHNIFISNFKNKYAMIHDGEKWLTEEEDDVIDDLIEQNELRLSAWVPKNSKKYPNYPKKYEKYEKIQYSKEAPETIKKEIKKMMYNNRDMIKN
jgi:hypothetical protein